MLTVTYVSVRDIPALLELVILQHLPLDSGARYAFTSISRYVLTAVGLIVAFKCLDGDWSKIQWLVAAMSVGLGFGLQEIFANFVSGIILLFERPIRVGDIVTLGEKSGVVNRIRMRATTIIDWDRKEYIVPNKDLVTDRLLNWTLSDQMNRIEILLYLSHGADTDQACELLLEAAREQPHVLSEPAPSAVFEGFTDAGLKLALRCFLPTLEHRGATIHQLYSTIDRKFRASGIEVSSPPREMKRPLPPRPAWQSGRRAARAVRHEAESCRQQSRANTAPRKHGPRAKSLSTCQYELCHRQRPPAQPRPNTSAFGCMQSAVACDTMRPASPPTVDATLILLRFHPTRSADMQRRDFLQASSKPPPPPPSPLAA